MIAAKMFQRLLRLHAIIAIAPYCNIALVTEPSEFSFGEGMLVSLIPLRRVVSKVLVELMILPKRNQRIE
jgi:hypothetical protein